MRGKYTSTVQDLLMITGQSSKGGLIAGGTSDRRGGHVCFFSAMDPLGGALAGFHRILHERTSNGALQIFKKTITRCSVHFRFDGVFFCQTRSFAIILFHIMPSQALVNFVKFHRKDSETEILFDTVPAQVTDVTRSYSSIGRRENPVQPCMEAARGHPTRPYKEMVRRKPFRDNSDESLVLISEYKENQIS